MQKFAVLGHPISHSLSPRMHLASFASLGFDGSYDAFDVAPELLGEKFKELIQQGYRGLNITIPHKKAIMPFLSRLDESAEKYGAVNTVVIEGDGTTIGYNTDVYGFLTDLKCKDVTVKGAKILMLGYGGAGAALACGLKNEGCGELKIANRTVREEGMLHLPSNECIAYSREADLIVNVTPVGLKEGDEPVLPIEAFRQGQVFYDCAPTSHETSSIKCAKIAGARAFDGKGFLIHQGAKAFELWTGLCADTAAMYAAIK
jgi:shikimate dehydrogenase